jgi:GcrA cell cycle regulator
MQLAWTDTKIELLRVLWSQPLSARKIADELGEGITRCAVIGKAHRLGLQGREARMHSDVHREKQKPVPAPVPAPAPAPAPSVLAFAPGLVCLKHVRCVGERLLTLMELQHEDCRWPIDTDEGVRYCGRQQCGIGSYCQAHARRAYVTPATNSRRRATW